MSRTDTLVASKGIKVSGSKRLNRLLPKVELCASTAVSHRSKHWVVNSRRGGGDGKGEGRRVVWEG